MQKIKNKTLIFLTACVNPNGMAQTAIQDADERLKQYLDAIRFYIDSTELPILVVENTNVDLSPYFDKEISSGRLECLTFWGNDFDRAFGKGYGEGLIINYAFNESKFIKQNECIIKVSGRHRVVNLNKIVQFSEYFLSANPDFAICETNPKKRFARSDMYITSRTFYEKYLNAALYNCDDSKNVWFENILFDCVKQAHEDGFLYLYLPLALDQRGNSGTSGREFPKTRKRRHLHFFFDMLMYKIGIYHL